MCPRRVLLTFLFCLLFVFAFLFSFLCNGENHDGRVASGTKMTETCSKPAHFVLVHGFGGGAWTWYKIRALMEASGYKVTCLDLKGAGIDRSDPATIRTFNDYNEPLINFLANLKDDEKVILVGYSAGGVSITDASHRFSKKIQAAVYVAATMLKHGFVTKEDLRDGAPGGGGVKSKYDLESNLSPTSMAAEKKSQCKISPRTTPQEDGVLGSMLWHPGPLEAILHARFKGDGAEQVRRVYIKTLYDQVLRPEQQDAMIKRWPPSKVFNMKTDHGLLSSEPFVLFGLLDKVADSIEDI